MTLRYPLLALLIISPAAWGVDPLCAQLMAAAGNDWILASAPNGGTSVVSESAVDGVTTRTTVTYTPGEREGKPFFTVTRNIQVRHADGRMDTPATETLGEVSHLGIPQPRVAGTARAAANAPANTRGPTGRTVVQEAADGSYIITGTDGNAETVTVFTPVPVVGAPTGYTVKQTHTSGTGKKTERQWKSARPPVTRQQVAADNRARFVEAARVAEIERLREAALVGYRTNHGVGVAEIAAATAVLVSRRPDLVGTPELPDLAINYAIVTSPRVLANLRAGIRAFASLRANPQLVKRQLRGEETMNDTVDFGIPAHTNHADILGSLAALRGNGFQAEADAIAERAIVALFR